MIVDRLTSLSVLNTLRMYVESRGNKEPIFLVNFDDKGFNRYISGFDEEKRRYGNLPPFDGSVQYFQHHEICASRLLEKSLGFVTTTRTTA